MNALATDQARRIARIVGETRQSIDEFLGGSLIGGYVMPRGDLAELLDRRQPPDDYIRGLHELFFGVPLEGDFESEGWRVALADRLCEHATFVNLLRVLDGQPVPVAEVADRLSRSLPVATGREALPVLDGLCTLIVVARRREGGDEAGRNRGTRARLRRGDARQEGTAGVRIRQAESVPGAWPVIAGLQGRGGGVDDHFGSPRSS